MQTGKNIVCCGTFVMTFLSLRVSTGSKVFFHKYSLLYAIAGKLEGVKNDKVSQFMPHG